MVRIHAISHVLVLGYEKYQLVSSKCAGFIYTFLKRGVDSGMIMIHALGTKETSHFVADFHE